MTKNAARRAWLPSTCPHCGGPVVKGTQKTHQGVGCIVLILGLAFSWILIGIPIVIYGIYLMTKGETVWKCRRCGARV